MMMLRLFLPQFLKKKTRTFIKKTKKMKLDKILQKCITRMPMKGLLNLVNATQIKTKVLIKVAINSPLIKIAPNLMNNIQSFLGGNRTSR